MASESIHVPSHQVRRLRALLKLILPVIMVAAGTAWGTTVTWIRTRTSVEEVQPLIKGLEDQIAAAQATADEARAQTSSDTQRVQIYALQQTVLALAQATVQLHAQAEVTRAYGKNRDLPLYIERARRFYEREFERQQKQHPHNVVKALRQTQLAVWRPDRND